MVATKSTPPEKPALKSLSQTLQDLDTALRAGTFSINPNSKRYL